MKSNTLVFFIALGLTACTSAVDSNGYSNDPWEPMNRGIYKFNKGADTVLFKPAAKAYEFIFPKPVRTGVSNFFGNINDVGSFSNAVLQLEGKEAAGIAARVINNTVFGLGGIFDVATPMGNPKIEKNFGSTLAHYGVKSGPYVVLPLFGPSTLRDGLGKIPDMYLNPISYIPSDPWRLGLKGLDAIQTRASFLPLEKQMAGLSTDEYATMRDTWLQYRWAQLGTPIQATVSDADAEAIFGTSSQPANSEESTAVEQAQ